MASSSADLLRQVLAGQVHPHHSQLLRLPKALIADSRLAGLEGVLARYWVLKVLFMLHIYTSIEEVWKIGVPLTDSLDSVRGIHSKSRKLLLPRCSWSSAHSETEECSGAEVQRRAVLQQMPSLRPRLLRKSLRATEQTCPYLLLLPAAGLLLSSREGSLRVERMGGGEEGERGYRKWSTELLSDACLPSPLKSCSSSSIVVLVGRVGLLLIC